MTKSITAGMRTHLDGAVTTLATCWKITRSDGAELFFTDHDQDLVVDGDTYLHRSGYNRSAIKTDSTLAVGNMDLETIFVPGDFDEDDLRAGLYDYAEVRIFVVNYADLTDGQIKLKRGRIGEVTISDQGWFEAEFRDMMQPLQQRRGRTFTSECDADLGDAECNVQGGLKPAVVQRSTAYAVGDFVRVATLVTSPDSTTYEIYENRVYECTTAGTTAGSAPAYDTTIGNTTTDGSAVFTARDAFVRDATVASVTDAQQFTINVSESRAVDDWFNGGAVYFETGDNAGVAGEIRDWDQGASQVTLFLPLPFKPAVGDALTIFPGCDKRLATCRDRFDNVLNFRGFPHVPGQDAVLRYPDAR